MKKLLFILDHLKGGGAERIALELCEELQHQGYGIKIILLDGSEIKMDVNPNLNIDGIHINPKFMSGKLWRNRENKFLPKERVALRQKIDEYQPDCIILSHWYAYCTYPIFTKSDNVFFWVHGEIFQPERKKIPNLFRFYKEYRRWHLDNKYFAQILNNKNLLVVNEGLKLTYQPHIPDAKIHTLPNGINAKKIIKQANVAQSLDKKWDCIFVGRLSSEKQPEHAIWAFANSGLAGRMAIVGDGQMKDELMVLCQTSNVVDRVDFFGWQTNPYQYIVQAKCLVLSSNTEGSPLVIAESLLLDVPVVAYNLNHGIRHQLDQDNLRRGLVESQNLEQLATTLADVVNKPYLICQADKERLSMQKMADNFVSIINNGE